MNNEYTIVSIDSIGVTYFMRTANSEKAAWEIIEELVNNYISQLPENFIDFLHIFIYPIYKSVEIHLGTKLMGILIIRQPPCEVEKILITEWIK